MNKTLKYIALVGVFTVPFISLIVAYSLFFPFITGKNFTFRIVIEIAFAAWIILAVNDPTYRPKRSRMLYLFAAFVVIMAVADIFSPNPLKSFWSNFERMEGWVTLAHLLAYFVVAGAMLTKERLWDAFFQTSLGVNSVIILYSFLQINHLLVINQGGVRVDATFGNATYLAIYLVFHIFIAALYLVRSHDRLKTHNNGFLALGFNIGFFVFILPLLQRSALNKGSSAVYVWAFLFWILANLALYLTNLVRKERLIYAIIVLFDLVMLFHTATRGAILGFLAGVLVTCLIIAIREREDKRLKKFSYGLIIVSLVVVIGFLALRHSNFVKKNPVLARFASISLQETTTLSRFKIWNMAYQGFKERPIFGWGQESFNYVFNAKYNPELYNQEQWFDRTHNVIFDWLIAGGILGLASYLAFFGSILYYVWKGHNNNQSEFSIAEKGLLTGLLCAYLIHNLFVFDNITSYLIFISIAAYVYHRTSLHLEVVQPSVENRAIIPVVAIALIVALYGVNLRPIFANKNLIRAISAPQNPADIAPTVAAFKQTLSYNTFGNQEAREQLITVAGEVVSALSQNPDQQIKGKDDLYNLTIAESKKQIAETPLDARPYVLSANVVAQIGNIKGALDLLMTAHKLSPRKQTIDFQLGSVYMAEGDYEHSYDWFKTAYDLEPGYVTARIYYAVAAIYTNKLNEVDKTLSVLSTSTIAASNEIMTAYYYTKQYKRLVALWEQRVADGVRNGHDEAQNHVSMAVAYLLVNNRKAAIVEIQKAIVIEPRFKEQGEGYIKDIKAGKNP